MPHMLILGMTESGKTTFAKQLHNRYRAQGFKTIVLDPIDHTSWGADFATDDPQQFLDTFWGSRNCMVFIDEAGDSVGRFDDTMIQTATKGRHWGHCVHYISQRSKRIAPGVRTQCSKLILFNVAPEDAKIEAGDWGQPRLLEVCQFPRGEYLAWERFGVLQKGNAFNS